MEGKPELCKPGVSVVVCTYDIDRFDQLEACLQSIHEQTMSPDQVIVVVDGCRELEEALRKRNGPETLVLHQTNRGPAAARNTGVAMASTKWVAFLDDDAAAEPTWLERLVGCAEDTGVAGAGGWSSPVFDGRMPRWFPPEMLWAVGCSYRGMPNERTERRNIFGGCAVLRADLFGLVGGYDVGFGKYGSGMAGGEEADFCIRVVAADPLARFAHVPDAVIHHRVGMTRLRRRYLLSRCFSDGRVKARIARHATVGVLNPEWSYLARTVPMGILRALAVGRVPAAAMLAAGAISAALGYAVGMVDAVRHPSGHAAPVPHGTTCDF